MAVITRQYTPPTCTLEITAQTSALSRWTRQPVLKSLNFLLSFNQLRDRNQQPLEVQGDREQLDSLSNAVSIYTQALLGQSLMTPAVVEASQTELPLSDAEALGPSPLAAEAPLPLPVSVHLRPQTLLSHELVLGSLANETSGSVIRLKASQLFDLATALDEYTAEVETLPAQAPQPVRPVVPVWARAAGVILFVGGTTVVLTQFLNSGFGGPTSTISSDNQESTSTESAPVAKLPSPLPDAPSARPTQALPQVQLPRRDLGDSGPGQFPTPLGQSKRQTAPFASGQTSKQPTPSAKLPQLPAPVEPDLETFKVPDAIEAPSTIAGRSPTELGQTNLGRSEVSQPETSVPSSSARSNAEDNASEPRLAQKQDRAISKALAPPAVNNTAFDVAPQISEARQYLAQRWQVPASLRQTLQYTLVLKPNGTIGQIKPRGQAATQYLSQTPIPKTNQPFVSPSKTSGNTTVRVVLGADGSVQTFLESSSSD
jgi:hypothetical protein